MDTNIPPIMALMALGGVSTKRDLAVARKEQDITTNGGMINYGIFSKNSKTSWIGAQTPSGRMKRRIDAFEKVAAPPILRLGYQSSISHEDNKITVLTDRAFMAIEEHMVAYQLPSMTSVVMKTIGIEEGWL